MPPGAVDEARCPNKRLCLILSIFVIFELFLTALVTSGGATPYSRAEDGPDLSSSILSICKAGNIDGLPMVLDTNSYGNAWGNELSRYWEKRAIAALAGVSYVRKPRNAIEWGATILGFQYNPIIDGLPRYVAASERLKNITKLGRLCAGRSESYPHTTVGPWTAMRPVVIEETQVAIHRAGLQVPSPRKDELVVHLRLCFNHWQQLWPGRSSFNTTDVLPPWIRKITILHQPLPWRSLDMHSQLARLGEWSTEDVISLLDVYLNMLKDLCGPSCEVTARSGTQLSDFITLATASHVFCTGSTFCLWAGLSNGNGQVHFPDIPFFGFDRTGPPPWRRDPGKPLPDFGSRWHWRSEPRAATCSFAELSAWVRSH